MDEPNRETKLPYYAVTLTAEQTKEVEHHEMKFYSRDGKTLFEVLGLDGKPTGEYIFYVIFV